MRSLVAVISVLLCVVVGVALALIIAQDVPHTDELDEM